MQTELSVEMVSIDRLFVSPSNPRKNEAAIEPVAASLRRFGWQQPVVARRSGEVIAGNTRLLAAKSLGMTTVPTVWFSGSDLDSVAFGIADNRVHEFSSWDEGALAKLLNELRSEDAIAGIGFSEKEIDELLREAGIAAGEVASPISDPGAGPPPVNPVTRPGDRWILGDHVLMCGDSTSAADVARLMNGEKACLYSTDPPYCVRYTGRDRPIHEGKPSGKDWSHVYREIDIEDLGVFIDAVFTACLPALIDSAPIYVWHAHVQQPKIAAAFEKHDLLLHQVLVWVKPTATFGHSFYRWRHEPCAFGWKRGHKPAHGFGQLDSIWEADWEGKARVVGNEHPTQKPLRLFEIPMEQHTKPGDIVLESFSGSGTQLLSAEKLGRRCRAMEISPAFVDVAIRRWQTASGKTATLDGEGRSFDEVRAERLGPETASPSNSDVPTLADSMEASNT